MHLAPRTRVERLSAAGTTKAPHFFKAARLSALLSFTWLVGLPSFANASSPRQTPSGVSMKDTHKRSPKRTSLTLQDLRLVDGSGLVRLILSTRSGNPEISLLGVNGQVLLTASVDAKGFGSVQIRNPAQEGPGATFALDDKGAHVKFDRPGGASSYLFLNNQGESGAVFLDAGGRRRLDMIVKSNGESAVERFDNQGHSIP